MTVAGSRIKQLREAKGLSQNALAKIAGVSQPVIFALESGDQQTSRKIPEIAAALGVEPSELDPRYGGTYVPPRRLFSPDRNMPVFAAAEGGNGFLIVSTDPIEYMERPHTLEAISDAYAILITGESMVPEYRPEDKAWVNPRLPPARNKPCVFYSIDEYGDRKATIKILVSWTEDCWLVEQHNPAKKFKLLRPQWGQCHRIVGKFNA